jgi:Icc-related predicted phosphoesterase
MLRITQIREWPHQIAFLTSGQSNRPQTNHLPFYRATVEGLPPEDGAVVLISDLQGREQASGNRLLGEVVAEELALFQSVGELGRIRLIVIAGDLYDYPDLRKRGGTGPVDSVWHACAKLAPVVGVMGNHDELNVPDALPDNTLILDGSVVEIAGLRVGGVSGITGDPKRNQRKSDQTYARALQRAVAGCPHLLILHQGPDDPASGQRGDAATRATLEKSYRGLTVFGHCHWDNPFLITLGNGQAINVDGRVVICEGPGQTAISSS